MTATGSSRPTTDARTGRLPAALSRARAGVVTWFDDVIRPDPRVRPVTRRDLVGVMWIWVIGRVLSLAMLAIWYGFSKAFSWSFGAQGLPVGDFLSFLTAWDADRYGRISRIGYPAELPVDTTGAVFPNDWAFMPIFPVLERWVSDATGWGWQLSGVLLGILFSAGATIMLFLLLRAVTTPSQARWAVILFSFGPLSFIFMVAYAESLFLFLLFLGLWLAVRRRYAWIAPVGVLAAYTRPGALVLALALGIVFLVRWARHRIDPFPRGQVIGLIVAGVSIAAAGLSWSWIVEITTDLPHAYVLTETSWWRPFLGPVQFVPLTPWFLFAWNFLGVFGILIVLAVIAAFALFVWSKPFRRLGLVIGVYTVSYGLYLFAVFLPQQSLFRLLLPVAPLLGHEKLSSSRAWRRVTLGTAIGSQLLATLVLWTVGYP
ncbi:hypothetical protein LQ938_04635 [Microbacterium sp. cx-55]|uniref:hypothetical protein n=1 Tax=Microbacterium sp. cx-55 TaxID=2875948 RepID=UPI001CBD0405|nr:hypothetical protein [Microbacterium sp. cx-55]MBZ4488673.1 hypothetical protein [Microbacterium sp. cx-55]UGB36084.1 hypothetical protein LQ938_04635 [Microbacterium sp. cx-55]